MSEKTLLPATSGRYEVSFTNDEVTTIKTAIMPAGSTDNDLKLFLAQCKRTGLDPFSRQIYATKQGGRLVIGSTIDGFRVVAERTGKYRGQVGPFWCGSDGQWKEIWLEKEPPTAAKVGVLKEGFDAPLFAVAKYESYKQSFFDRDTQAWKLLPQWQKQPDNMTAIAAERIALRKAFPNDLGGLYAKEELQADGFRDDGPQVAVSTNPKTPIQHSKDLQMTSTTETIDAEIDDAITTTHIKELFDTGIAKGYSVEEIDTYLRQEFGVTEVNPTAITREQYNQAWNKFAKEKK